MLSHWRNAGTQYMKMTESVFTLVRYNRPTCPLLNIEGLYIFYTIKPIVNIWIAS